MGEVSTQLSFSPIWIGVLMLQFRGMFSELNFIQGLFGAHIEHELNVSNFVEKEKKG